MRGVNETRVFVVAAEPSGDLLGRELVEELRAIAPNIVLNGIGGTEMARAGLSSDVDISPLSVIGLFEGLKAYPDVIRIADAATAEIIKAKPNAVVLIDSWGFMLRVAQRLRKQAPHIRIFKLIGPQVWATRAGRAKTLANAVDHLLAMFEMEIPYYEPHGLKVTVVGNPAFSRTSKGDGQAFRQKYAIEANKKILLVLPGSRRGELKRVAPKLVDAAKQVKAASEDITVVFSPAQNVSDEFQKSFPDVSNWAILSFDGGDRYDAMAAAEIALACSGTVTSELAIQETPYLVAYKLGWITWAIARGFLYKPDYISLLNIAAESEVAPEYFQTKLQSAAIAQRVLELLKTPGALKAQQEEQSRALLKMGFGEHRAAATAAKAIIEDLCPS